jgi:hypothetical protein
MEALIRCEAEMEALRSCRGRYGNGMELKGGGGPFNV